MGSPSPRNSSPFSDKMYMSQYEEDEFEGNEVEFVPSMKQKIDKRELDMDFDDLPETISNTIESNANVSTSNNVLPTLRTRPHSSSINVEKMQQLQQQQQHQQLLQQQQHQQQQQQQTVSSQNALNFPPNDDSLILVVTLPPRLASLPHKVNLKKHMRVKDAIISIINQCRLQIEKIEIPYYALYSVDSKRTLMHPEQSLSDYSLINLGTLDFARRIDAYEVRIDTNPSKLFLVDSTSTLTETLSSVLRWLASLQKYEDLLNEQSSEYEFRTRKFEAIDHSQTLANVVHRAAILKLRQLSDKTSVTLNLNFRSLNPTQLAQMETLDGETILLSFMNVGFATTLDQPPGVGKLCVTNYRLWYFDMKRNQEKEILLGFICRIENIGKRSTAYCVDAYCKNFNLYRFGFRKDTDRDSFLNLLLKNGLIFSDSIKRTFAFSYSEKFFTNGWNIYNLESEFSRQSVLGVSESEWRISNVNSNYSKCSSYPHLIVIPKSISDEVLNNCFAFRSHGRIPALTWKHPSSNAALCRSSQPFIGLLSFGKKSQEDEALIDAIWKANPNSKTLYIIDPRPKANAIGNRAKGAGYEHTAGYSSYELEFLGIDNIHVMRDSLEKLVDSLVSNSNSSFLSDVHASSWLSHVSAVLNGSMRIVEVMDRDKCSVLVHCSDGWDRTAQCCSIAQLVMDPFFRTVIGFETLIEKDWISFGHKFKQRLGHSNKSYGDKQRSPVFIQFLDCVWQLQTQFPTAFEFNVELLLTIATEMFSCRFGTFLCDNEQEAHKDEVRTKTSSLWSSVNSQIWKYANPHFYQQEGCLKPSTQIKDLRIWSEAYAGDLSTSQAESRRTVDAMIRANSENVSRLQQKAIKLMQQVKEQNKH